MSDTPALTSIVSQGLSADIDAMGAQLFALRDEQGRDLLWNGDPAFWTGRAPILFPIVGALVNDQYRLNGRIYDLPKHGFARRKRFEVAQADASSVTMRLKWDDETLAVYPFRFALDLRFALEASTLTIIASVTNLDDQADMPASFGFHPALRWPLPYGRPRFEHRLRFEREEPAPIRRIDTNGLVKPDAVATPVAGRDLVLRDDLFVNDAVIFDQLNSRALRYGAPDGPQLEVAFPDTSLLGVWTKPGAGYICIEPWHGWADPEGFAGDIWSKPGIFRVPPGQTRRVSMSITLRL